MPKLLLKTPRLLTLFVAVFSSRGVLNATPAQGLTFKGLAYYSEMPFLSTFEIEYTLADGIFDTIVSSPPNTFFIDGEHKVAPGSTEALTLATVVPEVVTDFKWKSWQGGLEPLDVELSIFGITKYGLYLEILDPNIPPPYTMIFSAIIQAPEGLPLSACKSQACELEGSIWGKSGYPPFNMIQTPVMESESVPEPSAAVALGFVGALLLKRHRKTRSAQAVVTTEPE
jgi:hypothetical protein